MLPGRSRVPDAEFRRDGHAIGTGGRCAQGHPDPDVAKGRLESVAAVPWAGHPCGHDAPRRGGCVRCPRQVLADEPIRRGAAEVAGVCQASNEIRSRRGPMREERLAHHLSRVPSGGTRQHGPRRQRVEPRRLALSVEQAQRGSLERARVLRGRDEVGARAIVDGFRTRWCGEREAQEDGRGGREPPPAGRFAARARPPGRRERHPLRSAVAARRSRSLPETVHAQNVRRPRGGRNSVPRSADRRPRSRGPAARTRLFGAAGRTPRGQQQPLPLKLRRGLERALDLELARID